jgi:hypothetical protein
MNWVKNHAGQELKSLHWRQDSFLNSSDEKDLPVLFSVTCFSSNCDMPGSFHKF